jgi:hypothetical protein
MTPKSTREGVKGKGNQCEIFAFLTQSTNQKTLECTNQDVKFTSLSTKTRERDED